MLLEVILAVLGVLIILVGIWNIFFAGSIVWGIVFLIGGIWALWLGISYILQIQKMKKKSNTQGSAKAQDRAENKKKDVTADEQPHTREESDMFFSRKETNQRESNLADYGRLSIENAVIMDEEVDDAPLVDENPVEPEIVSERMIFQEFIEESLYSALSVQEDELPEEISSETIEEDPEPIRFAEAEFIDDTEEVRNGRRSR